MSKPLRIGVIGCGGIAQMMHLPHLAERPDLYEIKALADVSRDTLDAVGRRYHVNELYQDPTKVASHPELDAVLLLNSGSHFDLAKATLAHKKHLFVEKPLGYGRRESEALVKLAKDAGVKTLIAYHKRFDPAFYKVRDVVKGMGEDLRFIEVSVIHPDDGDFRAHHVIFPNPERPAARASTRQDYDIKSAQKAVTEGPLAKNISDIVGEKAPVSHRVAAKVLSESLIHDINLVRGAIGEPEEVVSATVWRDGFAQTSVTRFPRDIHATMSWVLVPGVRHYEETVRFIGSNTRVKLVFPSPYLKNFPTPLVIERMDGDELVIENRTLGYEEAFRAEVRAFRDWVVEDKPAEVPITDGTGDAAWIEAIARSFSGGSQKVTR